MKKVLLSIIAVLISLACVYSQDKPDRKGLYKFIQPTQLNECDELGTIIPNSQVIFETDIRFKISSILNDGNLVIDLVYFSEDTTIKNKDVISKNISANMKYRGTHNHSKGVKFYLLTSTVFATSTEQVTKRWDISFGTASTLIKFRPGSAKLFQNKYPINSEIGNDFSIGTLVGAQFTQNARVKKYFLLGINYSNINVTPQTSQDAVTSDTNIGALTPSIALVFEFNKIQFGLFSGIDYLSGAVAKTWVYRGRPWIGFGVGFSIFKQAANSTNATQSSGSN